ncbi:radical SAM protein [Roseomonas alkaliterrae]|uniref:Putative Fe-S cluster-containing radical SAM superfamily protein n=1 Tax=Neoroseomonas alkaliterrae TaxID=1452450 RepID=A0A840Y4M4_9PROT|nr:radical SAM protein [Neoroseomonas alkaliterrae]MBB5689582.1 putative Fe-S cluster-containing radical SAM superfamily protein [Neoroseomonas alkaliterrae]MBR0676988.1 radical SAM protein [Neoroseomonas alkaliterrae]
MTAPVLAPPVALDPAKFRDPAVTAKGERRAVVALSGLRTLWVNTGTLCNITCRNCYIESSPTNDALAYISAAEVAAFLDEAAAIGAPLTEVGFTGGEPFLNRDLVAMLRDVLSRGLSALVLTNAMKPMMNHASALLALQRASGERLTIRVSLDHHEAAAHDLERGEGAFARTMEGLAWLARHGFRIHVAGRAGFGAGDEAAMRAGYAALFRAHGIPVDAADPVALMLFPEMDASVDVPEITEACWSILRKSPDSLMCASARMVVKRRGAERPAVVACTLLPYGSQFELGATLAESSRPVALNHPHCAKFCVLGGAACSR